MERRLTEEKITKAILGWLESNDWKIIAYDFPQSGTGISLHPNKEIRTTKNKGAIIPDIIAIKGTTVVFFENKDRFVLSDFIKVNDLRMSSDYSTSLDKLFRGFQVSDIYYGVGLPNDENTCEKISAQQNKVDFAICVNSDKSVLVNFQIKLIF